MYKGNVYTKSKDCPAFWLVFNCLALYGPLPRDGQTMRWMTFNRRQTSILTTSPRSEATEPRLIMFRYSTEPLYRHAFHDERRISNGARKCTRHMFYCCSRRTRICLIKEESVRLQVTDVRLFTKASRKLRSGRGLAKYGDGEMVRPRSAISAKISFELCLVALSSDLLPHNNPRRQRRWQWLACPCLLSAHHAPLQLQHNALLSRSPTDLMDFTMINVPRKSRTVVNR